MTTEGTPPVYTICVQQSFTARHYLIGGDWGDENDPHAHDYRIEVRLSGDTLDAHGYLVDIDPVARLLEAEIRRFKNQMLNDLPQFAGINPSLEHFARIFWEKISVKLQAPGVTSICVRLWENEAAWAEYRREL
jgi:6-pyruvoyltetrahydropterin/6-carboxytetrahydropterin synthase